MATLEKRSCSYTDELKLQCQQTVMFMYLRKQSPFRLVFHYLVYNCLFHHLTFAPPNFRWSHTSSPNRLIATQNGIYINIQIVLFNRIKQQQKPFDG